MLLHNSSKPPYVCLLLTVWRLLAHEQIPDQVRDDGKGRYGPLPFSSDGQ